MGEDLADVMAACAEVCEDRVAYTALRWATGEPTIGVIYSMLGSIALPHLTSRASNGLMPRLVLPISTLAVFTL